jgi:hypothetical protein
MLDAEIRIRTFWSCYMLDTQLHIGKNRRRLLQHEDLAVQRYATRDECWFDGGGESEEPTVDQEESVVHMSDSPRFPSDKTQWYSRDPIPVAQSNSPEGLWSRSSQSIFQCRNIVSVEGDTWLENPLSLYIKASNLLAQISSWTLRGGERYTVYLHLEFPLLTSTGPN